MRIHLLALLTLVGSLAALDIQPTQSVDPDSRASVASFYLNTWGDAAGYSIDWTGSIASCDRGTINSAFREATVLRVNQYRALCGLPPVGLDLAQSDKCQAAALMFSANDALSHNPPDTWECYSADGDEAAGKSNIAWGSGDNGTGIDAVDMYMDDFGGGNIDVGHRRWILYPRLSKVGSGSVPASAGHGSANALWVLGNRTDRPAEPAFVTWPPRHLPYQLLPTSKRWSFTYGGADFTDASVSVSQAGESLSVSVISRNEGFGDKALVFHGNDLPGRSRPATDTAYTISISGVLIGGVSTDFTYEVTIFDPDTTAPVPPERAVSVQTSAGTVVGVLLEQT
ncbi:MAG: CAP domain-containing protein, partial [Planctomycetota bacterium]